MAVPYRDGRLLVPDVVTVHRDGAIDGRWGRIVDPFERIEGVMLAESFARLDMANPRTLRTWLLSHGVPHRSLLFDGDNDGVHFATTINEIVLFQLTTRWHLETLLRLSDRPSTADWPLQWMPVLRVGRWWGIVEAQGVRWAHDYDMPPLTGRLARVLQGEDLGMRSMLGRGEDAVLGAELDQMLARGVDVLPIEDDDRRPVDRSPAIIWDARTWERTIALQMSLLSDPLAVAQVSSPTLVKRDSHVVISEDRTWDSLEIPITLQIVASLQRVSRGVRGAQRCRECGGIFLVHDGRRAVFCSGKEEHRYNRRVTNRRIDARPDAQADGRQRTSPSSPERGAAAPRTNGPQRTRSDRSPASS